MAKIARNGDSIQSVVASGYIGWRKWNPYKNPYSYCCEWDEDGNCIRYCTGYNGGYDYGTTDAIINGTIVASNNKNVFVNGMPVAVQGDRTNETATYSLPSGAEKISGADSGQGTITIGNNKNVFVGGKSVAVVGSNVTTYTENNTIIKDGSPNVFIGG